MITRVQLTFLKFILIASRAGSALCRASYLLVLPFCYVLICLNAWISCLKTIYHLCAASQMHSHTHYFVFVITQRPTALIWAWPRPHLVESHLNCKLKYTIVVNEGTKRHCWFSYCLCGEHVRESELAKCDQGHWHHSSCLSWFNGVSLLIWAAFIIWAEQRRLYRHRRDAKCEGKAKYADGHVTDKGGWRSILSGKGFICMPLDYVQFIG